MYYCLWYICLWYIWYISLFKNEFSTVSFKSSIKNSFVKSGLAPRPNTLPQEFCEYSAGKSFGVTKVIPSGSQEQDLSIMLQDILNEQLDGEGVDSDGEEIDGRIDEEIE